MPRFAQTCRWSVQAVDAAFAGSPFSSEQLFTPALALATTNSIPVSGDVNGDSLVDQGEFNTVLNNYWQTSTPAMQSVISPSNTNFHVLATTNVALPLMNWQDIGPDTLNYEFSDPGATN